MESLRLLNRDMEDMDDSFGSDSSMRFVANERSARKSIRYEILNDHKLKAVASLESQGTKMIFYLLMFRYIPLYGSTL